MSCSTVMPIASANLARELFLGLASGFSITFYNIVSRKKAMKYYKSKTNLRGKKLKKSITGFERFEKIGMDDLT